VNCRLDLAAKASATDAQASQGTLQRPGGLNGLATVERCGRLDEKQCTMVIRSHYRLAADTPMGTYFSCGFGMEPALTGVKAQGAGRNPKDLGGLV